MNQINKRKKNAIILLVSLLFLFVLINFNTSIIGFIILDNQTIFETEEISFGTDGSSPLAPANNTRQIDDRTINFIFNASAGNEWVNQSDAVNLETECGADGSLGITTNGTDFWFIDYSTDDFIYHLNSTGDNQSDAVNVSKECGADNPFGITTNGSDFWFTDYNDNILYHLNSTYDNQTDAVNLETECGSDKPFGITTNGSDFWFIDYNDNILYHLNSTYDNQTDAVNLETECGSDVPRGITTNGSDFWFTDYNDDFIYHLNSTGDNQSDGIEVLTKCGSDVPFGITTPSFNATDFSGVGTPTEFWIIGFNDDILYHIKYEDTHINNCSLLLKIDSANYQVNKTLEQVHNTSTKADHCVANYWFEKNASDISSNSNDGVIYGATSTTGILGYAYEFDGNAGNCINASFSNSLNVSGEFTISAWVKLKQAATGVGRVVANTYYYHATNPDKGWLFGDAWGSTDDFYFQIYNSSGDKATASLSGTFYATYGNKWTHVVGVYKPSEYVYLYINSQKINEDITNVPNSIAYNPSIPLKIGGRAQVTNQGMWNGTIDEVIIFNRTLSSGEISAIYNASKLDAGYNHTFTTNFDYGQHDIDWKIQGYDDLDTPYNTSEMQLTLSATPTVNIWDPVNNSNMTTYYVNFTYNVSDPDGSDIDNCSLFLLKSGTWEENKTDTSITVDINQTLNITYLEDGSYLWKVGCWDKATVQDNSSTRQLTIQLPIAAKEAEEELKGGSSSGVGKSEERTSSEITETKTTLTENVYSIDYLIPGETTLEIIEPYKAIIKVILDTAKEAEDITIKIDESRKTNLEKPKNKVVYKYANIESNLFDSAVNKIKIIFKVKKSFGDASLLRYTYRWTELPTRKIDEDESYNYYESESPGFSTFAIASEKIPITKKFVQIFTPIIETISKPAKNISYWLILPIIIIIILLLTTGFITYKIKTKEKPIAEKEIETKESKRKPIKLKKLIKIKEKPAIEKKPIEATQEPIFTPQPIETQPVQQPEPKPQVSPQEITNQYILRFNQLLKFISIDISQNNVDLANKRYQELLSIYKSLIIKVNEENRMKLYTAIEETYQSLRTAVEINYYKKKIS